MKDGWIAANGAGEAAGVGFVKDDREGIVERVGDGTVGGGAEVTDRQGFRPQPRHSGMILLAIGQRK